jgi:hypothetical protein
VLLSVFSDNINAIAALLVGIASVVTALLSLRSSKKRERDVCDQRIADIREAFQAGVKYEKRG